MPALVLLLYPFLTEAQYSAPSLQFRREWELGYARSYVQMFHCGGNSDTPVAGGIGPGGP